MRLGRIHMILGMEWAISLRISFFLLDILLRMRSGNVHESVEVEGTDCLLIYQLQYHSSSTTNVHKIVNAIKYTLCVTS